MNNENNFKQQHYSMIFAATQDWRLPCHCLVRLIRMSYWLKRWNSPCILTVCLNLQLNSVTGKLPCAFNICWYWHPTCEFAALNKTFHVKWMWLLVYLRHFFMLWIQYLYNSWWNSYTRIILRYGILYPLLKILSPLKVLCYPHQLDYSVINQCWRHIGT